MSSATGTTPLDEADAERFGGRHAHARQDHLERLAAADEARQPLRASAARDDGEVDLGQSQVRVLGGDPDVAGQRELEAAAQREAADGRDDGLGAALHLGAEVEALPGLPEMGRRRAARGTRGCRRPRRRRDRPRP